MSFHVVRHEHPTIFVMNRQTHETYRFTIGDDVALAHVGPPSDLAKARRTAIAFLTQRERENPAGGVPPNRRDVVPTFPAPTISLEKL
jgi:hypothetical protein